MSKQSMEISVQTDRRRKLPIEVRVWSQADPLGTVFRFDHNGALGQSIGPLAWHDLNASLRRRAGTAAAMKLSAPDAVASGPRLSISLGDHYYALVALAAKQGKTVEDVARELIANGLETDH